MLQKTVPVSFFVLGNFWIGHCPVRLLLGLIYSKNEKVTRYCDRVTDGFPCKQHGARLKRNWGEDRDGALKICNQLRDRMYAHLLRWQDAVQSEHDRLIPMEYEQYEIWSENARLARAEYLKGKLTAEEFLRQIAPPTSWSATKRARQNL